jgi:hypothetical protein
LDEARTIFLTEVRQVLRLTMLTPVIAFVRFMSIEGRHLAMDRHRRPYRGLALICGALSVGLMLYAPDGPFAPGFLPSFAAFSLAGLYGFHVLPVFLSWGVWLLCEHWNVASFSERPLQALISKYIDANALQASGVRVFATVARETGCPLPKGINGFPGAMYIPEYVEISAQGSVVEPWLLATASIPFGILPYTTVGGHVFVDGGLADNAPVLPLLEAGCDEIFVIHTNASGTANREKIVEPAGLATHIVRCVQLRSVVISKSGETADLPQMSPPTFRARIVHVCPTQPLGSLLASLIFRSRQRAERLEQLGYADCVAVIHQFRERQTMESPSAALPGDAARIPPIARRECSPRSPGACRMTTVLQCLGALLLLTMVGSFAWVAWFLSTEVGQERRRNRERLGSRMHFVDGPVTQIVADSRKAAIRKLIAAPSPRWAR